MKSLASISFILLLTFFTACSGNEDKNANETEIVMDTVRVQDDVSLSDEAEKYKSDLIFSVDEDKQTIKPNPVSPVLGKPADSVILLLNRAYPNVKLEKIKIGHDTLYTIIRDSEYLGERMGTTGASGYYADMIMNLTAVTGIRYVNLRMDEVHSHASPGIFSKDDYKDYKIIK